jgi:hypothetical protein
MKKIICGLMMLLSVSAYSQEVKINGPEKAPGRVQSDVLTPVRGFGYTEVEAREQMILGCKAPSSRFDLAGGEILDDQSARVLCFEEYEMINCLGICARPLGH